jgi:hypothetical protein
LAAALLPKSGKNCATYWTKGGALPATSINALPDLVLNEGQSFSADWTISGIDSLANVHLRAFADGATYSESVTDTLEITATVGWTTQVGDAGPDVPLPHFRAGYRRVQRYGCARALGRRA